MRLSGSLVLAVGLMAASAATAQPARKAPAWADLPRMRLEQTFAGPLQDTIVQRWRDPATGAACYLYLPISAHHSDPTATGFVDYGSNAIGTISCVAFQPPPQAAAPAPASPKR